MRSDLNVYFEFFTFANVLVSLFFLLCILPIAPMEIVFSAYDDICLNSIAV